MKNNGLFVSLSLNTAKAFFCSVQFSSVYSADVDDISLHYKHSVPLLIDYYMNYKLNAIINRKEVQS